MDLLIILGHSELVSDSTSVNSSLHHGLWVVNLPRFDPGFTSTKNDCKLAKMNKFLPCESVIIRLKLAEDVTAFFSVFIGNILFLCL